MDSDSADQNKEQVTLRSKYRKSWPQYMKERRRRERVFELVRAGVPKALNLSFKAKNCF